MIFLEHDNTTFQKKIKITRVQRELTLPRSKHSLQTIISFFHFQRFFKRKSSNRVDWHRSTWNFYDIWHNVYNSFDIESSNIIMSGKIFQNRTLYVVRNKRKDVTSKFIAGSRESWPLFPTSQTLTLSPVAGEYFRYDPFSLFKNTSALFPAPSQISKSRERDHDDAHNRGIAVTPRLTGGLLTIRSFLPLHRCVRDRFQWCIMKGFLGVELLSLDRRIQAFTSC